MFFLLSVALAFFCDKQLELIGRDLAKVRYFDRIKIIDHFVNNHLKDMENQNLKVVEYLSYLECHQLLEDWLKTLKKTIGNLEAPNKLEKNEFSRKLEENRVPLQEEKSFNRDHLIDSKVCKAFVDKWEFYYQSEKNSSLESFKKNILIHFCSLEH